MEAVTGQRVRRLQPFSVAHGNPRRTRILNNVASDDPGNLLAADMHALAAGTCRYLPVLAGTLNCHPSPRSSVCPCDALVGAIEQTPVPLASALPGQTEGAAARRPALPAVEQGNDFILELPADFLVLCRKVSEAFDGVDRVFRARPTK
jgi:hypothetical protein